uniref:SWIM-type domain-containing protein n=1 Tax=Brassica oleracea var. oleracea TaxID=109376 RepID=A0A0D3B2V4_BRAOL
MGNLLKSKEVASSNEMQVGSTSADVHTRNEVNDGETDLTEDEIILMGVAEIEAVYASNVFGMREVDGTACEVQNKVKATEDAALGEGKDADDEDYDYNLWHDFVGRNCEWDDDKNEDGGVGGGGRTNVTYGGRTANPPSTFEDYVDEGRDYIGSSRISMENIEEASNNLGVKSSDQVADTENQSDPNQEEDPCLDNSSQMSCTCLEFQKVGIPCRHAIAAAMFRDLQHSEFVADAYLKKTWNETTKGVTLPVPDPQDLFIPSEVSDLIMLPPNTKRSPGRPPTKRKRSAEEIPVRPNLI